MKLETLANPRRLKLRVKQRSNMAAQVRLVRARARDGADVPGPGLRRVDERLQPRLHHVPDGAPHRHPPEGLHGVGPLHVDHRRDRAVRPGRRAPLVGRAAPPQADHRHDRVREGARLWVETSTNATQADRRGLAAASRSGHRPHLSEHGRADEGDVREGARRGQLRGGARATSSGSSSSRTSSARPVEADIQIVRLSETDAEVAEFVERWRNSRADIINIKELDTWGDQIDDVSALDGRRGCGRAQAQVNADRKPCPNLWYHCHIHWDGVLVSCSRDYDAVTPLGNVKNGGVLKTGTAHACGRCAAAPRRQLLRAPVRRLHRVVMVEADARSAAEAPAERSTASRRRSSEQRRDERHQAPTRSELGRLREAATTDGRGEGEARAGTNHVRVAFVGIFRDDELPDGFERVSPEGEADVYHVRHDRLGSVHDLRRLDMPTRRSSSI